VVTEGRGDVKLELFFSYVEEGKEKRNVRNSVHGGRGGRERRTKKTKRKAKGTLFVNSRTKKRGSPKQLDEERASSPGWTET